MPFILMAEFPESEDLIIRIYAPFKADLSEFVCV